MRRTGAGILAALVVALPVGAPAAVAEPSGTHSVPPAAPSPTDSGNSPVVPDPHPPRGGLGPDGEPVGGSRLLHRGIVVPKGAPDLPDDLTARSFVVSDLDTGAVIAARDAHGRYQPASIQKILTTVTLLPLLAGSKQVTVSRKSALTEGSHAGLVPGGKYTIDQIFRGLLLVSGNDCAEALAAAAGGRAKTVGLMNRTAQRLGGFDTFIETPSGLDGWKQLTSAYDMTLFLRAAANQQRFLDYDRSATAVLPKQKARGVGAVKLYNQNEQFLTTVKGAVAAKTGFTDAAQHTFAGVIKRNGHRYGVVMLRAQRYPDDQWVQATKLVRWATKLPEGSAPVGTLYSAPTSRPGAVAGPATSTAKAGRPGHFDSGSSPSPWVIGVLAVALAAGVAVVVRRGMRVH